MDTQTMLIIITISALVLIAGLVIAFKSQVRRGLDRRVEATITQIQVEAGAVSSWWIVTAHEPVYNLSRQDEGLILFHILLDRYDKRIDNIPCYSRCR